MFNWICPNCGKVVESSTEHCPHCGTQESEDPPQAPSDQDETVVDAVVAPAEEAAQQQDAVVAPAEEAAQQQPSSPPAHNAMHLERRHYVLFAGALAVVILCVIWLSGGFAGIFSGLSLEDPEEVAESPVETFAIGVRGEIEVSGIRPYYDDEYRAHVRAFVSNHSKEPQSVALKALLRVREASRQAPPLATFDVIVPNPLEPNAGVEIDVDLAAMGSLQSLPRWDELRVDLEQLGAAGG